MVSKIKKPVSILLSVIMVFSLFTIVPFTASAIEYGVYVNQVNANTTTSGTGWSYNVQTNTLTLNNYNFNGVAVIPDGDPTVIMNYSRTDTFTIELAGTNTIVQGDSTNKTWWGIYSRSDLVITGDGTLNISTANGGTRGAAIYGEKNVTIDGNCTVNATSGTVTSELQGYGVGGGDNSSLTIGENAKVTLTGPKGGTNMTVKNAAPGLGWTDTAGTTGKRFIEASTSGQNLISYKKVQFPAQAVASVTSGGTTEYYQSLKDAITAAPNGSTVTLLKDVTETQTAYANNNDTYGGTGNVISGKTITITSNGTGSDRKTVTGSRFDVINGGNVTFTNIIIDGGVADSAHKIINNNNSYSYYFMAVSYGSTLTFDTGATVQNYYANAHGVIDVGNGRRGNIVTSNGSSTINIKDGSEFKNLGANYGVFREDYKSTINMSGGSVTNCTSFANEGVCAYVAQGSAFNMTGGEITGCSPEGSAPGLIFLHTGQANGNNKFTMTGGTISGNTAKLGGTVYSDNVNNTVTVGGSAVATGNTGTQINDGQQGSSNFYLAARQTMTLVSDNHLSGDSLIGIYSKTAPTDSADVKIATGAVKADIKHIHSDLPGNAGIVYCDGTKDWIYLNDQFVEVSCHHTSHQNGTVWLSTAVSTYEVTFDTDGGTPATIPAQTVVSNSKATKPADPTKDSYMFDGWYNGDTEFNFDTPITADTNLKAKWSVPVASVTSNGTTTYYSEFSTALTNWVNGSTLTLLADVTTSSTINVSGTKTLDLNGKTITMTGNDCILYVNGGSLTVNGNGGTLTGGKGGLNYGDSYRRGGAIDLKSGSVVLDNCNITNNTSSFGSAVFMAGSTVLTIQNGTAITNNVGGNAVLWVQGGTVNMTGGTISNNSATAVSMYSNNWYSDLARFNMSGGTISNNTGSGVAFSGNQTGQCSVSGNAVIKDNTSANLNLSGSVLLNVNGELGDDASIGITKNPGVFTNSTDTSFNDASKFFSDNSSYAVHKNDAGQLYLSKKLIAGHTLSLDGNIAINFYLDPSAAGLTAADVNSGNLSYSFAWVDQADTKAKVDVAEQARQSQEFTVSDDGKYIIVTCHVCAAEMTCGVNASFTLGKKSESEVYSVRDYCDTVFTPTADWLTKYRAKYPDDTAKSYNNLVALVTKMLDYGAKAQTVFGIKTGDPANTGLDYTMSSDTPDFDRAIQKANDSLADNPASPDFYGENFKAPSLVFLDYSTLKLYFENKDGSLSTSGLTKWNNYYYIKHENIAASQLDTLQTFTVSGKTFRYSALDYAKVLATSANTDNANLAKALYWYNQAANDYFG